MGRDDERVVQVAGWLLHPLVWLGLSVLAYQFGWYLVCGLLFCVFLFTAMAKAGRGRG